MAKRKIRVGLVVSNRMEQTAVVAVETHKSHPLYKKSVRRQKRYKAHDQGNVCQVGDKVRMVETRPLSKEKRWRIIDIVTSSGTKKDISAEAVASNPQVLATSEDDSERNET